MKLLTLTGRLLPGNARSAFFLLSKKTSYGRLDTLLLGGFVEGVLATAATAGVTTLAILKTNQSVTGERACVTLALFMN